MHIHMICIVILQTGLKSFCSRISENIRFQEISLVNNEKSTVVHRIKIQIPEIIMFKKYKCDFKKPLAPFCSS